MAYYIDEVKNTAVKAEGKAIYGWNHESRRFDLPVADATPKSRMSRCSESFPGWPIRKGSMFSPPRWKICFTMMISSSC